MNYTGRYPRTLQEAFGPYARLHVDRRHWLDRHSKKIIMGVSLVITCISIAALSF